MNENNIYPFYENPDDIVNRADADNKGGKTAEATLYKLLKEQLPNDWFVLYDIPFTGVERENQIDFLIIVPGQGTVNLECKGAGYSVKNGGRKFYHPANLPNGGDLVEKARNVAENFMETFNENLSINLGAYAKAIIFPLHNFTTAGSSQDPSISSDYFNFSEEPIYTAKDVHDMKGIINKCLEKNKFFWRYYAEGSAEKLFNHFRLLGQADNGYLHELNAQNANKKIEEETNSRGDIFVDYMILNSSENYQHFSGTAGTGKTWIAKMAAKKFAENNPYSHILYVCYNKALAADVSLQLENYKNIDVGHFHRLARICFDNNELIVKTNNQFDETKTDQAFFNYMYVDGNRPKYKYDLILVDEAQDFNNTKCSFIAMLAPSKKRKIVFFSDINQNLYNCGEEQKSACETRFSCKETILKYNLRNTVNIHSHSKKLLVDDKTLSANTVEGPIVEVNENANIERVTKELVNLRKQYSCSNIALLSDQTNLLEDIIKCGNGELQFVHSSGNTNFKNIQKNLKTWRDPNNKNKIWTSTIHAFKGLEATVVLLVLGNDKSANALHYVGVTRAKYCLKIFYI